MVWWAKEGYDCIKDQRFQGPDSNVGQALSADSVVMDDTCEEDS